MSFDISFIDQKTKDNNEIGSITIGSFTEDLIIPTSRWTRRRYEDQWVQSLSLILRETVGSVGLITEIYPEGMVNYVNIWPIYRVGDDIYVQNRLLFLDENPGFSHDSINAYLGERELIDSEGNSISEWKANLSDIKTWLDNNKR